MSALTLQGIVVDPSRVIQQPPPAYIIKPAQSYPVNEYHSFTTNTTNSSILDADDEDVDTLEDDDEDDDLEDDEDDYNEAEYFTNYHHISQRPQALPDTTHLQQSNNYLSINHIISPNNTQAQPEKREPITQPPQALPIPALIDVMNQRLPPPLQGNVNKEPEEKPLDLLKENRHLRKKVESLMAHNMQLMLGIKERDHKVYQQKRLLQKYRKALLRFFEENESGSSSDEDLSNLSSNEAKTSSAKKEAIQKLDAHIRTSNNAPIPITPTSTSAPPAMPITTAPSPIPPPAISIPIPIPQINCTPPLPSPPSPFPGSSFQDILDDKDDDSLQDFDFETPKKRKGGAASDLGEQEPDKKRRGPRRNALWTPEDDEMFQKIYSVYGKSWKTIHNYMPGKTREQVQSHGQYLIRIGKLEDVKTGPRRGRKSKKEKGEKSSSSPDRHSSSHHHHSPHSSHHSHSHSHSHHSSSHSHHHHPSSSSHGHHSIAYSPLPSLHQSFDDQSLI